MKNSRCSRCNRKMAPVNNVVVDGKPVCPACLYSKAKPFKIYPIGIVYNKLKRAGKGFDTRGKDGTSRIKLFASQKPFLYKLEEEEYITIVYYLHEANSVASIFKRGLDGKEVGVFASRTPYRLSRIGIQDVRLAEVKGAVLFVEGLDAVNGTPILDIKMRWSYAN